jgi:hypothetical protein
LQATGKLFVFDSSNQNWIERGRGLLRLNDLRGSSGMGTEFHSRLGNNCLKVKGHHNCFIKVVVILLSLLA